MLRIGGNDATEVQRDDYRSYCISTDLIWANVVSMDLSSKLKLEARLRNVEAIMFLLRVYKRLTESYAS